MGQEGKLFLQKKNSFVLKVACFQIILWMVAPGDKAHFHPTFLKELEAGKQDTTSKKPAETRQKEILENCSPALLKLIAENAKAWLANGSVAMVTLAVLKTGILSRNLANCT